MRERLVTFGEIMLRLSPPGYERFLQTPQFVATFGGGEANVAVTASPTKVEKKIPNTSQGVFKKKLEIYCFCIEILTRNHPSGGVVLPRATEIHDHDAPHVQVSANDHLSSRKKSISNAILHSVCSWTRIDLEEVTRRETGNSSRVCVAAYSSK